MKHLKLFEEFDENDPFGEEIEYVAPTFLNWLKQNYPDENTWSKIESIDCHNNQLTSLEGVENLVGLRVLFCPYNQLTGLEGVENLVGLEWLCCYDNQLTSLEGVENLVGLKWLSCWENQLTSLEEIENLSKLNILRCSDNRFSDDYKKYLKQYCKKKNIRLNLK